MYFRGYCSLRMDCRLPKTRGRRNSGFLLAYMSSFSSETVTSHISFSFHHSAHSPLLGESRPALHISTIFDANQGIHLLSVDYCDTDDSAKSVCRRYASRTHRYIHW